MLMHMYGHIHVLIQRGHGRHDKVMRRRKGEWQKWKLAMVAVDFKRVSSFEWCKMLQNCTSCRHVLVGRTSCCDSMQQTEEEEKVMK